VTLCTLEVTRLAVPRSEINLVSVVVFFLKHRHRGKMISLLKKVSLVKTNCAKSSTAEVPLVVREGRQCGCVGLNVAGERVCFAFCVKRVGGR